MTQIKLRRHCSGVAIKQFSGDSSLNASYLTTSLNGLCSKESDMKLLLWSTGTGLQCWVSLVKCSKMTLAEFPLPVEWNQQAVRQAVSCTKTADSATLSLCSALNKSIKYLIFHWIIQQEAQEGLCAEHLSWVTVFWDRTAVPNRAPQCAQHRAHFHSFDAREARS